jgi:hypothetical protein
MANPTTNYGFVLPTSTDLVTDLPADFDVALQGVDTRLKALQPGTTLGDLAYSSATANTNTRLAIGSTGNVLTVSGGVPVWAAPGSASPASAGARTSSFQTTTSTSYTDLATAGPAVTLTTGTKVLIIVSANASNSSGVSLADFAVSGATTRAATDDTCLLVPSGVNIAASQATFLTVTAGSNTFTAKYRTNTSTSTFGNRGITVIDLGS